MDGLLVTSENVYDWLKYCPTAPMGTADWLEFLLVRNLLGVHSCQSNVVDPTSSLRLLYTFESCPYLAHVGHLNFNSIFLPVSPKILAYFSSFSPQAK
jgi:hypothetical protein